MNRSAPAIPDLQVDVESMNKQVMASYKTANGLTKSLDGDEVLPWALWYGL